MFSKGKGITPRSEETDSQAQLVLLRQENELGHFLQEQLQDQATAMVQLGTDLVARPSHQMVAAMACAWLVQHVNVSQAIIIGKQADALVVYAEFPPNPKSTVLTSLVQEKVIQEAAHHGTGYSSQNGNDTVFASLFSNQKVQVVPLGVSTTLLGCLVLSGEVAGAEALAVEVARALNLASTLAELGVQTQKLRELDTIRNSFIATTSHQLRTPLSIVKWMFSIFLSDPELVKMDKQMQMIKQAYSGVERIVDVVNDLLNVSRIQDGRLPYSPQMADPNKVIQEVIQEIGIITESHTITVKTEIAENIPEFPFDAILFREALRNLVNNAIDYNQDKGSITFQAMVEANSLVISVSNTGIGITTDERERVFMPLYRGSEAVLLRPDGSGLGLYLAQAIARAHGGSLTFVSQPGEMTTFTLTIPLQPPPAL